MNNEAIEDCRVSKDVFIYPKNPIIIKIISDNSKRYVPLAKLTGEKGFCKWCMIKVSNLRKKYCSKMCKDSAWAFFYPQKHAHRFLMARQNNSCAKCGYDFLSRVKKWHYKTGGYDVCDMGDIDHIIPIFKGGEILGIDNIQLLCRECHRAKSINERKNNE